MAESRDDDLTRLSGNAGEQAETRLTPEGPGAAQTGGRLTSSSGWLSSSGAIDHGRFAPGTVLGGRYRIVGRLGRGGMGEVYRADDLKLGQAVALKFLPADLDRDPARLTQLHTEVRMARQVAHPNVCRVYDIDEVDGHTFLSMEYVDGEDLASLLRRIGRFPEDRALAVARQICAGLAAAHERDVVHRDFKPANVMLDGSGKVRITDFGLAGVTGEALRAGTPAYMAPEQLAGTEVTARSDIYALGLVLYEAFTGQRALDAKNLAELIRKREQSGIVPPSALVRELDPAIEQAIMQCLRPDPAERPASALAVSAALPGGDPLAAALAAGETPSPEMVAAAGTTGAIGMRAAVVATAFVAVALVGLTFAYQRVLLVNRSPLDRSIPVLTDRVQEMLTTIGYPAMDRSNAAGLSPGQIDYLLYVMAQSDGPDRWDLLNRRWPSAFFFWYRTSPRTMVPVGGGSRIGPVDPPLNFTGQVLVATDVHGRLAEFHAMPPQVDTAAEPAPPVNWEPLFAAAGLDPGAFTPAAPTWVPRAYADQRVAWTGQHPEWPDVTVRVEAAAYRDRPVFFLLVGPWTRGTRQQTAPVTPFDAAVAAIAGLLGPGLILAAALLARRNLRLGHGDRRGAFQAAAALFGLLFAAWILTATHVPDVRLQVFQTFSQIGSVLFNAAVLWLAYLAVEPYVRRHWPGSIIGWSRLTTGRWSDARVARDVLVGLCAGLLMTLAFAAHNLLPPLFGLPEPMPLLRPFLALYGFREMIGATLMQAGNALQGALLATAGVVFLAILLRRTWLGASAAVVVFTPLVIEGMFMPGTPVLDLITGFVILVIFIAVIVQYGLLASVAALTTHFILLSAPLTTEIGSWRGAPTLWTIGLLATVTYFVIRYARARR